MFAFNELLARVNAAAIELFCVASVALAALAAKKAALAVLKAAVILLFWVASVALAALAAKKAALAVLNTIAPLALVNALLATVKAAFA